jgi:exonuclease III
VEPFLAISVYGMLRYADQSLLRVASDLVPLFDTRSGRRVVLGGDFNIHTHSNDPAERRRAGPILAVFESLGLVNLVERAMSNDTLEQGPRDPILPCPCQREGCSHVRTHRHRGHAPGEMANNDYLFASPAIADRLVGLSVMNGDNDPAWSYSDHCPLVAVFDA